MLSDIIILAVLILLNGFFSCAELGIISVNSNKIKLKADAGDKKAVLIKNTIEHPDSFLSTIQISISLIGLFSGAYAGQTFSAPIVGILHSRNIGISVSEKVMTTIVFVVITILLSYFTLVFGELVPKRIALEKSERIASMVILPVYAMSKIFSPFVKFLSFSTGVVIRFLGIKPNEGTDHVTEEEIRMMVDAGGETGNIDEEEMVMINNIFEFDDKAAEDIATHRTDISAIDIDDDMEEIMKELSTIKYSRIPVYEENIDNIIGILHVKDIMKYILEKANDGINDVKSFDLKKVLRKPYFVPTSKKTDELFKDMKLNKIHIAIVIDEYGGTVGLVTMEDLIEEIMGNIFDEYDEEEAPEINVIDANTFHINGTASLEMVAEALDAALPVEDYDTLGGFVIGQLGRIPSEDEQPEVEFNGLLFKVEKVEDKRIASILVCKVS